MTIRHTVDTITSDALDALYAENDRLTAELSDYDQRVIQLEAAVARVHHVADLIEAGAPWTANHQATAARIRTALNEQTAPTTGYCPACGRGDLAPTADEYEQQRQRAETAEHLAAHLAHALADAYDLPVETVMSEAREAMSRTGATAPIVDRPFRSHRPKTAPAATQATEPREHCGELSPETGLSTVRTECVLPPGHSGSHADDRGARWWYDPTGTGAPCTCGGRFPLYHLHADQHQPKE